MKYKGVIFDLDGTLVNSLEDIADAMNSVLLEMNYPTHSYDSYQYFIGNGLLKLVQRALPADFKNNKVQIEKAYESMIKAYTVACTHKTKVYDGIFELLDNLAARNIKLSVFSNKSDELTKEVTRVLFPNYFDPILGLTTETLKKPNPFKALEIAKKWKFEPYEIIFVGDSDVDMQTATNANMHAIGVLWGYRSREDLLSNGAKQILNHPTDLITIL